MTYRIGRPHTAHLLAAALAAGLALSVLVRPDALAGLVCVAALLAVSLIQDELRVVVLAAALLVAGLTWGGLRLDKFDSSHLRTRVGDVGQAVVEVTSPVRTGSTRQRMFVAVREFEGEPAAEPAQLEAPLSVPRPRRGDVLEALVRVTLPEGPRGSGEGRSFDEAAYLARNGIQVVLEAPWIEAAGTRGGVAGASDRVRRFLAAGMGEGMGSEQRALVRGVVLGEDEALDDELLERFRDSGLFHLLRKSQKGITMPAGRVVREERSPSGAGLEPAHRTRSFRCSLRTSRRVRGGTEEVAQPVWRFLGPDHRDRGGASGTGKTDVAEPPGLRWGG